MTAATISDAAQSPTPADRELDSDEIVALLRGAHYEGEYGPALLDSFVARQWDGEEVIYRAPFPTPVLILLLLNVCTSTVMGPPWKPWARAVYAVGMLGAAVLLIWRWRLHRRGALLQFPYAHGGRHAGRQVRAIVEICADSVEAAENQPAPLAAKKGRVCVLLLVTQADDGQVTCQRLARRKAPRHFPRKAAFRRLREILARDWRVPAPLIDHSAAGGGGRRLR